MAGLWAISLGIDPRFPTFSLSTELAVLLYSPELLSSSSALLVLSAGVSGPCARPLAWLDPRWVFSAGRRLSRVDSRARARAAATRPESIFCSALAIAFH